jgi:hypothetical protein
VLLKKRLRKNVLMRGDDLQQSAAFSHVSLQERVPANQPLRPVRKAVDQVFRSMNKEFDGLYATTGRPSIAPERLLRSVLLQTFYSIHLRLRSRAAALVLPL